MTIQGEQLELNLNQVTAENLDEVLAQNPGLEDKAADLAEKLVRRVGSALAVFQIDLKEITVDALCGRGVEDPSFGAELVGEKLATFDGLSYSWDREELEKLSTLELVGLYALGESE